MCLLRIDGDHTEWVWELEKLSFVEPIRCYDCVIWSASTPHGTE
jgi:hypothetical protein